MTLWSRRRSGPAPHGMAAFADAIPPESFRHIASYQARFGAAPIERVVHVSLDRLGFFTAHAPRLFEYPWIIDAVMRHGGEMVVDLGAGVSPVPLILSGAGKTVMTVDNSSMVRVLDGQTAIHEWGFLDYATLDPRMRSVNTSFESADFSPFTVNCVYSISVIEHMPATVRRSIFAKIGDMLVEGGSFIATFDLHPKTYKLWNYALGVQVDASDHGTLHEVIVELQSNGIFMEYCDIVRDLPGAFTDIVCLMGRKG